MIFFIVYELNIAPVGFPGLITTIAFTFFPSDLAVYIDLYNY